MADRCVNGADELMHKYWLFSGYWPQQTRLYILVAHSFSLARKHAGSHARIGPNSYLAHFD